MADCFAMLDPTRALHGPMIACSSVARQPSLLPLIYPHNHLKIPLIDVQIFTPHSLLVAMLSNPNQKVDPRGAPSEITVKSKSCS